MVVCARCAGRLPTEIGQLSNLTELLLDANKLTGQCPNTAFEGTWLKCHALTVLVLVYVCAI